MRIVYKALAALALSALATTASAQQYPEKPIRLVIPFPPGGGTDVVARVVAQKLGESTGWTLVADNKPGTLNEEQVRYASAIYASNNDLLTLINDILDLSRIEAGHVELAAEPLDLQWVATRLRDTFQPLAAQKGLALRIEGDFDASAVGDAQRLKQILKNLLANAIKFTAQGEVSLRLEARAGGRLWR